MPEADAAAHEARRVAGRPPADPDLPSDPDVAALHGDLPGLALLLDASALDAAIAATGLFTEGPYLLERLRLKPGTSVTAILRSRRTTARLLARGLAPQLWEAKRHKDIRAARRAGLGAAELSQARTIVTPAAADRHLGALSALRPDTGIDVAVGGLTGRAATLSHNPARRWVGRLDGDDGSFLLRLHGTCPVEVRPWTSGRSWRTGDPVPAAQVLRESVAPGDEPRSLQRASRPFESLRSAASGLDAIHRPWAVRAHAVVAAVAPALGRLPLAPAHGDLSPDQLVIGGDDRRVTVLDWDRAGWWPCGWDAASWVAARVRDGVPPETALAEAAALGTPAAPVLAAAAILRCPEPFRRRHRDWAAATHRLLEVASASAGLDDHPAAIDDEEATRS